MSGTISFPGLSTDWDFGEIIDALVNIKRNTRIEPLENWKSDWETKIESISTIDSALSSFYATVRSMDRISEFMVRTTSSSNTDVADATADSTSIPGSYSVQVGSSIKHRFGSDGKTDYDTTSYAIVGDQIQIIVGTDTETLTLNGGDYTLQGIADEIDTKSSLVDAEVIDDGSDSNQFRLVLTAKSGGSSNSISIGTNDTLVNFSMSGAGDNIDTIEYDTWSGTGSVISGGDYLGTTNKTFQFSISGSDSDTFVIGTDEFDVSWTDSEGNSGTVSVTAASYTNVEIYQGVTISFGGLGDSITGSETFSLDVWHPDLQAAQDDGVAKTEKEVHSGFTDKNSTAVTNTDQTFSYTYNGRETTISISAGATLTDLKNLINNDGNNPGVTATILNDGSGLSTAYHLILNGNDTGSAYKISSITHTLDNFDSSFSETQSGQNAMLKVDSYPPRDEYIQKFDNHIDDVIEGVSLDIYDSGSTTITVGTDNTAIMDNIESFRNSFNNVRSAIQDATSYDADTGQAGTLLGNYAVQIIKSRLDSLVSGSAPGFVDPDDTYINLHQLGFYTDAEQGSETEGLLLLDMSELNDALNNDPDSVAKLFSSLLDGITDDDFITFSSSLNTATPGIYDIEIDTNSEKGRYRLEDSDWGDWIDLDGTSGDYDLTGVDGPEKGISLHVTYSAGTGTYSAQLRLRNGILAEMSSELQTLLSSDGPLSTIDTNYNDIIDNIEDKIEAEELRLSNYEDMLIKRFSRLDSYMSTMSGISTSLSSITSSLQNQ